MNSAAGSVTVRLPPVRLSRARIRTDHGYSRGCASLEIATRCVCSARQSSTWAGPPGGGFCIHHPVVRQQCVAAHLPRKGSGRESSGIGRCTVPDRARRGTVLDFPRLTMMMNNCHELGAAHSGRFLSLEYQCESSISSSQAPLNN